METELINITTVTGIFSVFVILVTLYLVFILFERIMGIKFSKKRINNEDISEVKISGEEATAIITAIHVYTSTHEQENSILTIQNSPKQYSPWSSKVFSVYNSVFYKTK